MSDVPHTPVIELLPEQGPPKQLFILLHGLGASASSMLPLAVILRQHFPDAAVLMPEGFQPYEGVGHGGQWFSVLNMKDGERAERVGQSLPLLEDFVRRAQARFGLSGDETAIAGFSQGAIMALELTVAHDGLVGRVLAFSGRFAQLPNRAPELTTLHLFHGEEDTIMPVQLVRAGYTHLAERQADATLDVASEVGHVLHPVLIDRAVHRLQTCIPLRVWRKAL
ncbi:Phospholipase/carboxylesterase family protein [plant metagenome]|uniref:Phospholipase/carboxylesterase family protein n=2 Tax=root TaxID=1 RepID=A0A1C3JY05_9BURK|nr:esterase [Orrella dioscoreae]SBT24143.1 Phospholipase/carboxylesterase family protein [Orrella dioscoreae]SOE51414.1 Phospholipase/carboxylesterase family protein [Orrella dioscoreae]